jgi:prepilin-type N-terminal cleavage/methylation domain-containing protein
MFNSQSDISNQHSKGFTLIEIVITIVIVGIIAGIASMIILQGARTYSAEDSRGNAHYQARLAVERVAREARLIRSCGDITYPMNNPFGSLTFTDVNGNSITFSVAGGNLSRGANILANGVTSATPFRFLNRTGAALTSPINSCGVAPNDIWYLEIDLTDTQGSETLEIRTRVHPMNF